jgi:hypothetical protein
VAEVKLAGAAAEPVADAEPVQIPPRAKSTRRASPRTAPAPRRSRRAGR